MGNKPLRACRHPGCCVLTEATYCPAHVPVRKDTRSAEAQSWRWMYKTDTWLHDLRPNQLAKEPFCRECTRSGVRVKATDVDHVKDHKGDWKLFSDPANLQSLCHSCHSRKTLADLRKTKQKTKHK